MSSENSIGTSPVCHQNNFPKKLWYNKYFWGRGTFTLNNRLCKFPPVQSLQAEQDPKQPNLLTLVLLWGRGRTAWPTEVPSNRNHSVMILHLHSKACQLAGQLSISLTHSTLVLYCLAFLTAVAHDVRSNLLISIMLIKLTGRLIFKKWQLRLLVSIYFTHSNDDWY